MIEIANFCPHELCDKLIEQARPLLTTSLVQYGDERRAAPDMRQSDNVRLRDETHETTTLRQLFAAHIAAPIEAIEAVDVVRYEQNGFFRPHHDGLFRSHTCVVALSDDYDGGELLFPARQAAFRPTKGDAVIWENDDKASHSCQRVTRGEKWIAVLWAQK